MFLKEPKYVAFLEQRLRTGEITFPVKDHPVRLLLERVVAQESNLAASFVLHLADEETKFETFTTSVGLMLQSLNLIGFVEINSSGFHVRSSFAELIATHLQAISKSFLAIGEILDVWQYATAPLVADLKPTALQTLILTALLLDKKLAGLKV